MNDHRVLVGLESKGKTPEAWECMWKTMHLGGERCICYLTKGVAAKSGHPSPGKTSKTSEMVGGDLSLLETWPVSRTVCVGLCRALGWRH